MPPKFFLRDALDWLWDGCQKFPKLPEWVEDLIMYPILFGFLALAMAVALPFALLGWATYWLRRK